MARMGVTKQCVYQRIAEGSLPAVRVRTANRRLQGQLMVPAAAVERFRQCPEDLSIPTVAQQWGCSHQVVYLRVMSGRLPSHLHGTRMLVRQADAERLGQEYARGKGA
jgi:predicted DNA-binding transcriptional regulator AlpA